MNTVDLRRMRRTRMGCAAVAAFAVLGSHQASAEVANPNLVPAKSAYIISVPDSGAFWQAWQANGLYGAYNKIMAMPEVEEKVTGFRKELSIVESSLGFKLDGATLSQVFSAVDVYMTAPGTAGETNGVGIFKVADQAKLNSLIDLGEKAAAQAAASDEETTGTEADDSATSPVQETEHAGVKIKSFQSGDDGGTFVYANSGDYFVIGNDEGPIKEAIDRIKASEPAMETVAQSEEFKKIDAALAAEKGEVYVYGNQELAMNMQASGDLPANFGNALKGLMDDFAPLSYYGASVKIEPKEISSYSYGLLKEGTSDSLMLQYPGDQPLKVASYIPENTMFAGATSLFNAQSFYDLISGVAGDSMDDNIKNVELGLGFSIKNDFVPAIGNEVAIALNDVKFGGLIPSVDATIMLGVKDKAKMQKVVDGVERLAENAMAARSGDSETTAPKFESSEVAGQTVKSMAIPGLGGLAPSFSLTDDLLVIGSTKPAITNALNASSGTSLASGDTLKGLGHEISANANVLQYVNLGRILGVAKQVASAIPAVQGAAKYIDTLDVLDTAASISRVENGAAIGRGVLKLK